MCLRFLSVLCFFGLATAVVVDSHCQLRITQDIILEDHNVPPHPADMMGTVGAPQGLVSTQLDVYQCFRDDDDDDEEDIDEKLWNDHQNTLLVFAAGAPLYLPASNQTEPAGKEALSVFATQLAQQGYVAVMADKPNRFMNISTFLPVDFLRVVEFMQTDTSWLVSENSNRVPEFEAAVIGGHGFGGGMVGYALTNVCPTVFCPPQPWPVMGNSMPEDPVAANQGAHTQFSEEDLTTFAMVKAAFWYGGTSGWQPTFSLDPSMTGGSGVPLLMMYGTGEDNIVGSDQRGMVTYDQWGPQDADDKAFLVLEGLDHNGMTDEPITLHENPVPSTLPAETRASLVVQSLVVWLDTVLPHVAELEGGAAMSSSSSSDDDDDEHYLDDFCRDVMEAVGEDNLDVCLPKSPPESEDSSDDAELGVHVGVPVAVVGVMMVLLTLFYVLNRRQNRMSVSHHGGAAATAASSDEPKKKDETPAAQEQPDEEEGAFSNGKVTE